MNEQAYELTALAMRYWFTGLILVACLCGLRLLIVERKQAKRERLAAPNMEYVGELLVVRGSEAVPRGERYAVQRDFVIGRRRKCDVCLADRSVFPRHARGELRNGGMLIGAIGRAPVSLRGQPLCQEVLVKDGALFCVGGLTLQLTLYDVPVEYVPSQSRAIDATDVNGDRFDDEAPFEHEFDEEYGPRRDANGADQRYDADDDMDDDMDGGLDTGANADGREEDGSARMYDEFGRDAGRMDEEPERTWPDDAAQDAGEYFDAPDAEYQNELERKYDERTERAFRPITIRPGRSDKNRRTVRTFDDDDDRYEERYMDDSGREPYDEMNAAECELDEYEEYALETGGAEPDEQLPEYTGTDAPYAASGTQRHTDGALDELQEYPGAAAIRRAAHSRDSRRDHHNEHADLNGRVRRS